MKYDRLLIRGPRATNDLISFAAQRSEVGGVVLGEPLCPHRSNLNEFQIIPFFEKARRLGLYVSYQTPVYCTDRNLINTIALSDHLASLGFLDDIRVQDMGVLEALRGRIPANISLTWSIYGYQREFPDMEIPFNNEQIEFLSSLGADSFEITSAVAYSIYRGRLPFSFRRQLYHYSLDPVSFSRTCYTENFTSVQCHNRDEISPSPPERPCDRRYYLTDQEHQGMKYVVEGHRILEIPDEEEFMELKASDEAYESLTVEGKTTEEIASVLDSL